MKLKHIAKQVIEEKIQHLNEVDYEEIFSPETMSLLKKQSKDELVKTGKNLAQMINTSATLIPELIAAEQPHIDLLEEIAKEIVTQAYPIIKYSKIKINASIGKGELPKGEAGEEEEEQPNIELPQPTLTGEKKRRIINGITQGASIRGTFAFLMFREYLDDLGEDMVNRYNEVMKSVFGIFDDENAIAMMLALLAQGQKSQGGESEAEFDEETGILTINATAICFPMLVHESVKGLYEILSLQGFGTDAEQNKSIVGKADQLAAEPNDMRFGKFIYDAANKLYIESGIEDDRVRDFFFTELYKIDDETEFIQFVENLVTSKLTSAQKKWAMDTMREIERDLKADDAGIPNDEGDEEVFTEIKVQPKSTGLNSKIKKLNITLGKYNLSGDEIGSRYPWVYAQEKLSPTTKDNAEYFFKKLNIIPTKISIGLVYRGELSNEEFNNLSDIEKINKLETERKAKSFYIEGNYKGTPIIIARKETRSPSAGQTNLFSPYAKLQFSNFKDLPANEILAALKIPDEENIDEIKAQPGKTGLKDDRITITQKKIFYDGPPNYDANVEYGMVTFGEGTDSKKWINTMYVYTPSKRKIKFQPLGEPRYEKVAMLKQMLDNKKIPYTVDETSILPTIDINDTDKYLIFKKDTSEIKVQPVNKLIKPTKKENITSKPYIDMDASFIEDYILDYGEDYFDGGESFTRIADNEYIDYILNFHLKYYFNDNKKEIDYVLTLDDPLNIKDYARDKAETLSDNPEDIDFFTEEIMLAIETIQDNIPKYIAAKKILKDKFTIISNDEFSVILTSDSEGHSFLYTMIEKQDGYFNKNGEIVIYTT